MFIKFDEIGKDFDLSDLVDAYFTLRRLEDKSEFFGNVYTLVDFLPGVLSDFLDWLYVNFVPKEDSTDQPKD